MRSNPSFCEIVVLGEQIAQTMIYLSQRKKLSVLILMPLFVYGCSENGGDEGSRLNASAGYDVNVLVGQHVTLNGNGSADSQGNVFDFSWKFILTPDASTADLENADTAAPDFTPDVPGKYKVELTISNTMEDRDTVTISAFEVEGVAGNYENLFPGSNVGIRDYLSLDTYLIATCEFTEIGGIEAHKIAYFNGSAWSAMGCGLEDGSIYDMVEYQGDLYVTGQFEEIGCIEAKNIARWDFETKTWNDVDGGITGGDNPFGEALAIYNGELYVGGLFTTAGNVSVMNIAKWDGSEWSAVGSLEDGSVREFEVYKGKLYAGGFFTSANGIPAENIANYDGTNWSSLGSQDNLELQSTGAVKHMAVLNDILYIAGEFSDDDVSELITYDGAQFHDFGRPFSLYSNLIYELSVINGVLYIGGDFNLVVGTQAHNFLQWNGKKWGIPGTGTNGPILAIEEYDGKIYLGGDYTSAGGEAADKISIWTEN